MEAVSWCDMLSASARKNMKVHCVNEVHIKLSKHLSGLSIRIKEYIQEHCHCML